MTTPNVAVATAALRAEADVWDGQLPHLKKIAGQAESLRMTDLEAGIFMMIVDAYSELVDVVTGRCAEGQLRMGEIAATLRKVADIYDAEDAAGEHCFRGLY